jgi:hypothetical protein
MTAAVVVSAACLGCGGSSPISPDASAQYATVSGWVYEAGAAGEPPVADATIEVTRTDGSIETTRATGEGWYAVSARTGVVTMVASKEGYESKTVRFSLWADTTLNFRMNPR